jgi:hypothetical protein
VGDAPQVEPCAVGVVLYGGPGVVGEHRRDREGQLGLVPLLVDEVLVLCNRNKFT